MNGLLRLLLVVSLAVLLVVFPEWRDLLQGSSAQRCSVARTPELIAVDPLPIRLAGVDDGPPFRDALVGRYELPPDSRFLIAFVLTDCLLTGERPGELRGAFESGAWVLQLRGQDIGSLPALPDFSDAMALISRRSREIAAASRAELSGTVDDLELQTLRARIGGMQPTEVAGALVRIDSLWTAGTRHPPLLELAATALVRLALLADDELDIVDPLVGRALAALSMAREIAGSDLRQEEALLALKMGYASHAYEVARTLPEQDPVRMYVLGDEEGLRRLAELPYADGLTRQLGARGFASVPPEDELEGEQDIPAPTLMPPTLRLTVQLVELLLEQHGLNPNGGSAAFERDLGERTRGLDGPFLDADTYAAYLSAAYYSHMYREASRDLRRRTGVDAALARRLEGVPEGLGWELSRWYAHAAAGDADELEADLAELRLVGPHALDQTRRRLVEAIDGVDPPRQVRASNILIRQLDSRVTHQFILGPMAASPLFDFSTVDRIYERIVELAGPRQPEAQAWLAKYQGDADALANMMLDSTASSDLRAYAVRLAPGLVPDAEIREAAQALIDSAPLEWDTRADYVDYLENEGDIEAAVEVVSDWLETSGQPIGFPTIFARTAMARLLQARGDLDEAYAWVEPVLGSGQNGALGRAALIQAERGMAQEATILAERSCGYCPQSVWSRSVLAEVHWRLGRPEEAADGLRDAGSLLGFSEWGGEIAQAFARAFENRPTADAVAALDGLARRDFPFAFLLTLAGGLRNEGRPDLSFELASRFGPGGMEGMLWMTHAYGFLAEAEGEERAITWFRGIMATADPDAWSDFLFSAGHQELLWAEIPEPEATAYPSWVWLMRAAAFVQDGEGDYRRELMAHFAAESDDPYHRMGRFLMGLDSEEQVLAVATEPDRLCEVAFYVGLKAQAEGRIRDAIDWYRVVLDTGLVLEGEYHWAFQHLGAWVGEGKSVAALTRDVAGDRP